MDIRLAELSRSADPVRLGQRLKLARVAAGLTQTQLAGGEVTAAYVSRIEAGQRRPEATLLERMAARLGVELATLLEEPADAAADDTRVRLDHAELALVSGDSQTALSAAAQLLEDPATTRGGLDRRARAVLALALEATGDVDEAIRHLEILATSPVADVAWIKTVIALSRCYRERGDYKQAISAGEEGAKLIDDLGLGGTTESIQLTVTVAGAYLQRGDLAYALQMCQRCAQDAEAIDSPVAKGSAYWNASIIESMRGHHGPALALAQKALTTFESGEDSRNLGRLRIEIAYMHLLQAPPDAASAKEVLARAERELNWSAASQVDHVRFRLYSGRADLELGDLESAEAHASAARALAEGVSPTLQARTLSLAGQVQARRGDHEGARRTYHQAVAILSAIGVDREIARLWFELGGLLEESGDVAQALDAYRRGATATGLADPRAIAEHLQRD